jgi:hypothetical protein
LSSRATYKENGEVEFKDLLGKHDLSGVDYIDIEADGEPAQQCRFVLNGVTYTATEDPSDGYRSCLGTLKATPGRSVANTFKPCRVDAVLSPEPTEDCLVFHDANTGLEILRIGTHNDDDYYPSFVANFQPQHMSAFIEEHEGFEDEDIEDEGAAAIGPHWGTFS